MGSRHSRDVATLPMRRSPDIIRASQQREGRQCHAQVFPRTWFHVEAHLAPLSSLPHKGAHSPPRRRKCHEGRLALGSNQALPSGFHPWTSRHRVTGNVLGSRGRKPAVQETRAAWTDKLPAPPPHSAGSVGSYWHWRLSGAGSSNEDACTLLMVVLVARARHHKDPVRQRLGCAFL